MSLSPPIVELLNRTGGAVFEGVTLYCKRKVQEALTESITISRLLSILK